MILKTLFVLFLSATLMSAEFPIAHDDVLKLDDNAVIYITYSQKGTRSEGQTGRLFINKIEIIGQEHEVRTTGSVNIKWYGANPGSVWLPRGWNYEDRKLIIPSYEREASRKKE